MAHKTLSQKRAATIALRLFFRDRGLLIPELITPGDTAATTLLSAIRQAERVGTIDTKQERDILARLIRVSGLSLTGKDAPESRLDEVKQALSRNAPILTGRLAESFINGGTSVEFLPSGGRERYGLRMVSVPYARINDLGGNTGRNHATHIDPAFYTAAAEAQLGLPDDAIFWR